MDDEKYFRRNIVILYDDIYRFIYSLVKDPDVAQNLSQSTMEKAWTKLYQLRKRERAKSWLFQIAKNEVALYFRDRQKDFSYDESLLNYRSKSCISAEIDLSEILVYQEESRRLIYSLDHLDLKYQELIKLWALGRLNLKEIAEILQINYNTARTHLRRGLEELRNIYFAVEKNEIKK